MDSAAQAEFNLEFFQTRTYSYAYLSGAVVLLYDSFLTLGDEVTLVWKKPVSLGSVLYKMTRYCNIVQLSLWSTLYVLGLGTASPNLIKCLVIIAVIINFLGAANLHGLLMARAYAVSGGKAIIAAGLALLYFGYIGLILTISLLNILHPDTPFDNLEIAGDVLNIVSDAVVVSLTCYYAWANSKELFILFKTPQESSLIYIFARQGVMRFVIILVWVLEITIATKFIPPLLAGIDTGLQNAVSASLICRFVLELRRVNGNTACNSDPTISSIGFGENIGLEEHAKRINQSIIGEFGDSRIRYLDSMTGDMGASTRS